MSESPYDIPELMSHAIAAVQASPEKTGVVLTATQPLVNWPGLTMSVVLALALALGLLLERKRGI